MAAPSLSSAFGVEEPTWRHDPDAAKLPQLEQMVVAGDDRVGAGLKCALENSVVGFVLAHHAHRLLWMDEDRKVADCRLRLSHSRRGPAELASQNATNLIEDCAGDAELYETSATESEHLIGLPAKFNAEM